MILQEPLRFGAVTLRNRVVSAPMERNYCDLDGTVTDLYIDYLSRRASGGAALVFTEATYVRQDGKSRARQMGLVTGKHETGLKRLADRVHAAGGLLGVELNHGGRTSQSKASGRWPVAPSPIPLQAPGSEVPHELSIEDIRDIVACFGVAAARARRAGVDVLSIHGAHGYLIQAFMSLATNHRTDAYADPARFAREVIDAVRAGAPGVPVGLRLSAFEGNEGGLTAEQQLAIFEQIGPDRLDFVDVSAGNYEAPAWSVQPAEFARGLLAPYAEPYRKYGIPVGVAGRIVDEGTAEGILEQGQADFISMARALHADPDFPRRVFTGQTYRPCIACNLCADELATGNPIRCSVNVEVAQPDGETVRLAEAAPGRVLVVGAGPSGLEAACLLAEAGHQVTVLDEHDRIGGQFRLPTTLKAVPEYHRLLDWYKRRLTEAGVTVELGIRADAVRVQQHAADVVLLATGSHGTPGSFPGAQSGDYMDIRAWLDTRPATPAQVTIIGGDREAVAVGYDLSHKGTEVTIITEDSDIGLDVGRRAKILTHPHLMSADNVTVHLESSVDRFDLPYLHLSTPTGPVRHEVKGPILTTLGAQVTRGLVDELPPVSYIHLQAGGPLETVIEALTSGRRAARETTQRLAQVVAMH